MMSMYVVTHRPTGVIQASTPVCQFVGMPIIGPRDATQSLSEWSGIPESTTGAGDPAQQECVLPKTQANWAVRVPKNVPVVMSEVLQDVPCDRCWKVGRQCFPQTNGGQALSTCAACYEVKMSCKTSMGVAASKKEAGEPEVAVLEWEEPEAAVPKVEEYTSCIEGAGCSRKSLHKQLSTTVKVKGKR